MQPIQWYPGHMTKARRMMAENLKLIDVIIELVDARAPYATRNPDFDDLFATKERIVLLNKSDLAAPEATAKWREYYKAGGWRVTDFVSTANAKKSKALELIDSAARDKVEKMRQKGVNKTVRAMVAGIPNVGKSTFINRISGAQNALVANRPGVTRGKQWVNISPYLELMDTPGMLWPKITSQRARLNLAFIGAIRDEIMDIEQLAMELLLSLAKICPGALCERYKKLVLGVPGEEMLRAVCASRGFLLPGGRFDTERGASMVIDEFRSGKIARVTLELPDQIGKEAEE